MAKSYLDSTSEIKEMAGSVALDTLMAHKREEQKKVASNNYFTAALKGILGAGAGAIAGFAAILGMLSRRERDIITHREGGKFVPLIGTNMVEEQKLMEETFKTILKEESLTGAVARNPGTFVTALSVAGAGLAFATEYNKHERHKIALQDDINALQNLKVLKNGWENHVQKPELETEHSPSPS